MALVHPEVAKRAQHSLIGHVLVLAFGFATFVAAAYHMGQLSIIPGVGMYYAICLACGLVFMLTGACGILGTGLGKAGQEGGKEANTTLHSMACWIGGIVGIFSLIYSALWVFTFGSMASAINFGGFASFGVMWFVLPCIFGLIGGIFGCLQCFPSNAFKNALASAGSGVQPEVQLTTAQVVVTKEVPASTA
jgi:hypothetical protein